MHGCHLPRSGSARSASATLFGNVLYLDVEEHEPPQEEGEAGAQAHHQLSVELCLDDKPAPGAGGCVSSSSGGRGHHLLGKIAAPPVQGSKALEKDGRGGACHG